MCGIAGIYSPQVPRDDLSAAVARMIDLERHRGPDDAGVWGDNHVALGNCRLSILDLSPAGHQPMTNADQSVWVIQNGEIYNFEELKCELVQAGYVFRSNCDTEVLLHGYTHWGPDFVRRLRGMFALVVWDVTQQRLLLARDRFGIKPLYYRWDQQADGSVLFFASEIKPILAVQRARREPNPALIYDFLAHRLLEHTDGTFFQGVVKLPPAHYLLIDRDGQPHLQRYWDLEVNPEFGQATPEADHAAASAFRAAFFDSIRAHLVSDVSVGSCLSGGLDSSAVVCTVSQLRRTVAERARALDQGLWTFTSCFNDQRYDERQYAEAVAVAAQAKSHLTFPTVESFLAELPQLVRHQEEPFASTSIYAQWCLMRDIHRSGLKVALDGQGGDEQLLGYGKFYLFYLQALNRQRRYTDVLREALGVGLSPDFWLSLNLRHGLRYFGRSNLLAAEADLIAQPLARQFADRTFNVSLNGSLAQRIRADLTTFSLPVLLRYEDKNSMAFSVEARVPFVDHLLAEHIAALPLNQKLRNGWTKYIMRQSLRGVLPDQIRLRKTKWGFVTPEAEWMRQTLSPTVEQTFASARFLPDWANLPRLREAFAAYRRGSDSLAYSVFFRYFIAETWARQFFDGHLDS